MALTATPKSTQVALTTTPATTVFAGPGATISRFVRHIKVVNGGAATTFTLGFKASTTAPASNDPGALAITQAIAANSAVDIPFAGDGYNWTNASTFNLNGSCATSATVNVIIVYNETAV